MKDNGLSQETMKIANTKLGLRVYSGRLWHVRLTWTGDFGVLALPLVVAPPNLQNHLTLTSECAFN